MAQPRIFISSTFYDLKHVRNDLERFIIDLGYEPIMNERGQIAYNPNKENLDESCYKEIGTADILVSIVGGRFGSTSSHNSHASISQTEVKTAIEEKKQVFIFIEKGVYYEYNTYQHNKDKDISYVHVDNKKIYEYIDYLYSLNTIIIHPFESSTEITIFLKEQFAGLFQRFLREQKQVEEFANLKLLSDSIQNLNKTTEFLQSQLNKKDENIQELFFSTHPAVQKIAQILKIKFRMYFLDQKELKNLLINFGYWRKKDINDDHLLIYVIRYKDILKIIKISSCIFKEDGQLKTLQELTWNDSFIKEEELPIDVAIDADNRRIYHAQNHLQI